VFRGRVKTAKFLPGAVYHKKSQGFRKAGPQANEARAPGPLYRVISRRPDAGGGGFALKPCFIYKDSEVFHEAPSAVSGTSGVPAGGVPQQRRPPTGGVRYSHRAAAYP